ncbi:N-6 DNA methylase [Kribbella sp. NBC_01505]|uniref:type ISP restriction/modification enzyme n=1 Tax=Kribbella sp. NBC_01505 TaxID=2903580 RepID=UPI00386A27D3
MARTDERDLGGARANADPVEDFGQRFDEAVSRFGSLVAPKLRAGVGQSEANLTSAVEALLLDVARLLGLEALVHSEAAERSLGIRPDLAVDVAGARIGVVELKAPGVGVPGGARWGKSRDRSQWERFKALPNVMYTDGSTWAVYHYGQPIGHPIVLDGDLARAGSKLRARDSGFASLMSTFLLWEPAAPRDLRTLIKISAGLCSFLREEVSSSVHRERKGDSKPLFTEHLADWQEWLFPDLTDDEFVDAYAQTITFGLLLARREGVIFEGLEIPDIGERLAKRHLLVGRALSILTARPDRGLSVEERSVALQTMRRVIGAADWSRWPSAGSYHWLYEEFLQAYDPALRKQTGAYYTPTPIADFMARFVDEVLQTELGLNAGLSNPAVVVLDPAMGTGTFLQSVLDRVAEATADEGGDVPASLRALLNRLIGFERQIGPYAVAELKLDRALDTHNAEAKGEDFRLYVADTLDDPDKVPLPIRARLYAPLADSRRAANKVKAEEQVMVVLGNPPYRARAKNYGKWVLQADRRGTALLDDFREASNGKHEHKLHDLAIYFWRWALWKAFESTPDSSAGVVAFITTQAYLDGPAFAGMRRYLRRQADRGWIVDLSPEGHRSSIHTRVFPGVPHPVCIGIFVRKAPANPSIPATILHTSVEGTQAVKFAALAGLGSSSDGWSSCTEDWTAPLRPIKEDSWARCPEVGDLFPVGSLGFTTNRAWVHSPSADVLRERWRTFVLASANEKRKLLKETRDRTIDKVLRSHLSDKHRLSLRNEKSPTPSLSPVGYRSFDRQYLISDERVIDFPRLALWSSHSEQQVYLVTQTNNPITGGPAVVFSRHVPDVDFYKGRGGRVHPLYCDATAAVTNIAPGLAKLLRKILAVTVSDADVMAYVASAIAHSDYTDRFRDQLQQGTPRVPVTWDPELWREAVEIGREVIWLHTYFECFEKAVPTVAQDAHLARRPAVLVPIPGSAERMPDTIELILDGGFLQVGLGRIGPVSEAAWNYEVSGMRVIKHWFDYRKRTPAGRRGGSALDTIVADRWTLEMTEELRSLVAVIEGCVALEPRQADLLERILSGRLITNQDLTAASVLPIPESARRLSIADPDRLF